MKSLKYPSRGPWLLLATAVWVLLGNTAMVAEATATCSGWGDSCPRGETNCAKVEGCRWRETPHTECYPNYDFTQTCITTSSYECTGYAPCVYQTTQESCGLVNGCQWSASSGGGNTNDNDEDRPTDGEAGEGEFEIPGIPSTGEGPGPGFGGKFSFQTAQEDGISAGAIVGIVLAILILHGVALGFWYYRKRQRGESNVHGATDRAAPIQAIKNHETVYRWVVFGLIVVSWIFTVAATGSCQFLSSDAAWGGELGVGFFNYEDKDGCSRIDDKDGLDEGAKAARTFAVFACLLTSTALVLVIAVQLFLNKGRDRCWLVIRVSIYCSSWCTLLTFLAFGSGLCKETDCKVGAVGVLTILIVLLLVGLNVLLFFVDAGPEPVLKILKPSVGTVGTVGTASAKTNDIPEVVKTTPSPEGPQDASFPDDEEHAVIENIENEVRFQEPTTSKSGDQPRRDPPAE